jgi:hypothetical protein
VLGRHTRVLGKAGAGALVGLGIDGDLVVGGTETRALGLVFER